MLLIIELVLIEMRGEFSLRSSIYNPVHLNMRLVATENAICVPFALGLLVT